jgi:nucleotide-binding universal stress UspA family protein
VYRKILIPVSTPREVEPLLRFGSHLLDSGGELRLLHVIPTLSIPQVTAEWRRSVSIVVPAHETGAALDVNVEPEVRAAKDVPGEILERAESQGIDAILLTLRGDRRSRLPFVGHTATALLQHAPCDVIIVNRLGLLEDTYDKIIVPTLTDPPPRKAMLLAEQLSVRSQGIPILTIHFAERAVPSQSVSSERGVPRRHKVVPLPQRFLSRGNLAQAILTEVERERSGLCLVGEDSQRSDGPLLTRRFLEDLFRNAPCPILALRD